jgi:hypothetical protein
VILLEDGVVVVGNRYTREIMTALQRAYGEISLTCTLTAGLDGKHGATSYHYQGRALDVRRWNVPDIESLAARIRALLPKYYDVIVEKTHLHIEADTKKELANA